MIEEIPNLGPWEAAVVAQIAAERATRRMSVNELAKRVGIHPGSMPRYMSGERHLTLGMVERFALALDIDLATLLSRADERQSKVGRPKLEVVGGDLESAEPETPGGE